MKELEKGKDKIQQICEMLKQQTLSPAQEEASHLIANAHKEAEKILMEARNDAQQIFEQGHTKLEKARKAVHMALEMASKQAVGHLKEQIEEHIFEKPLSNLTTSALSQSKFTADLLNALITAIAEEGMSTDIGAVISKTCSVKEVNALLLEEVATLLKSQGGVSVGNFEGGVKLLLKDKNMIVDISDQTLKELLAAHLRKDFRQYIFGS